MFEYLPYVTAAGIALALFVIFVVLQKFTDVGRTAWRKKWEVDESDPPGLLVVPEVVQPKTPFGRLDRWFDDLVQATGLGITTPQALGVIALSVVIFGGLPLLWRTDIFLSMAGVVVGVVLPLLFFMIRRTRWRWQVEAQLPDSLFLMARSIRAGLNLEQALATAARYSSEPLATEYKRVVERIDLGLSVPAAVQGMARRLRLTDFNILVTAVTLHRSVGGNLALLLERVANSVRDRAQFRGYFRAATALGRITAFAIAAAPPLLLLGYWLWQPDFMRRFVETGLGIRLLATAVILEIVGIVWMYLLLRYEY